MNNLLPEEQDTIETYNHVAQIWVNNYNPSGFWAAEMEKFQQLLPKGRILEIGAGGVRDARELLAIGYEYVGTDISIKLLEEARKLLPNQKFYLQSVYDLDFLNLPKFDGFWSSKVLLHLPKKRINEALQRIKTVIRPGAIGFISLIDGRGEELRDEKWDDDSRHKRYFAYYSKQEFTSVLDRSGYKILDYSFRPESKRFRWHCFFVRSS